MRRARRGFSLLEAIVGVAIAAAFVAAIAIFASNLGDVRARLARSAAELETADAVFSELGRACAAAVVDDARLGAGVSGNESSVALVRCAVGLGEGRDELLSDRSAVRIEFDAAARRIVLRRGTLRDELPAPVRAMRVRYLDDGGWTDSFDSAEAERFPALIEVSLWFERGFAADDEFLSGASASDESRSDESLGDESLSDESSSDAPLADSSNMKSSSMNSSRMKSSPSRTPEDSGRFGADPAVQRAADRTRVFRIAGAPRIDPLAIRRLREEREP